MDIVIGPILHRAGAYAFDTWTAGVGLNRGYPYHRIGDADYARKAAIREAARSRGLPPLVCPTIDEFVAKTPHGELRNAA